MSPQRVADAARISPFTDSQESQPGRSVASVSENADSSQSRSKKGLKKPPRDRNARQGQEEEMRFNVGPPTTRSANSNRGRRSTRAGRQDRLHNDGRNDNVPNYPPPSFQEAISSSSMSVYPSTTTLVPTSISSISYVSPEILEEVAQPPPVPLPQQQGLSESSVSRELTPESDSESSIELVEGPDGHLPSGRQLEEQVKNAWRRQNGVEFPRPSAVAPDLLSLRSVGATDAQRRGRSPIRLDTEPEHLRVEIEAPTPTTPKRRHLSLLPLKTFLPSRIFADRALSAHPTPTQSPYASSPMSFFRSTGSLATGSLLKLPLSPTASTAPTRKTSFLARTLFSKGKEKDRAQSDAIDRESLHSWEVLAVEEQEPISLMSAVETISENMPSETVLPSINGALHSPVQNARASPSIPTAPPSINGIPRSPVRHTPSATPSPVTSVLPSTPLTPTVPSPPSTLAPSSVGTGRREDSTYPIHPLSERDRKVSATLFINRQVRKQNALKSPSRVHLPSSPVPQYTGPPPLTTVRTRVVQDINHTHQTEALPTTEQPIRPESPSSLPSPQDTDASLLQRALETPLPSTPLTQYFPEPEAISPTNPTTPMYTPSQSPVTPTRSVTLTPTQSPTTPTTPDIYVTPIGAFPTTPIPGRAEVVGDSNPSSNSDIARWRLATNDEHAVPQRDFVNSAHRAIGTRPSSITISDRSPSPTQTDNMSPRRRHYPGRPLPRPPGPRPPVDSTYAPSEDLSLDISRTNDRSCPEGLLIDLNDPSPDSGFSTPRSDEGRFQSQLSLSLSPTPSHADLFESTTDLSLPSSPRPDFSLRHSPVTPANLTSLTDMTDLDILLSQLCDGNRDGSDYEALLLVQELMGPATPIGANTGRHSPGPSINHNISLIGRIDIERRRVTKDGRVKLKLGLLGVAVDRCGICLSQFRGDDLAGLGSVCKHAFHQKCIERWVDRNKTCPMCRIPLDVQ